MTEAVQIHTPNLLIVQAAPPQVQAGVAIALKVRAACPDACDLQGTLIRVLDQAGGVIHEASLGALQDACNETAEFSVRAPDKLGEYLWSIIFPEQAITGILHTSTSVSMPFEVQSHQTSLVVWDLPSPAILNTPFPIKVGVKCSAECQLAGTRVEAYDEKGKLLAAGTLGETPLPQTTSLYWTEMMLTAPTQEAVCAWHAKFPALNMELPHEATATVFHFRTAKPPEHIVTIQVINRDFKTPVRNADLLLGTYRSYTDEFGMAKLHVPKGEYAFRAATHDYELYQTHIEITDDVTLQVELVPNPF